MNNPQVSIIVPCYNQGHFLEECIKSIQCQSYKNWEIIIVNDGSNDNTEEVALSLCRKYDRIHYYKQENRGLSGARNTGINLSKGEFIHFLDSDDTIDDGFLDCILYEFQIRPELQLVFCGYKAFKDNFKKKIRQVIPSHDDVKQDFFIQFARGNIFPVHGGIIRREVINNIGFFDESLKGCEDWDFWVRLGRYTNQVKVVKKAMVNYRMTGNSMTRNVNDFFNSGLKVIDRIKRKDYRVIRTIEKYEFGATDFFDDVLKGWYIKCIGLYLSKRDVESALKLTDSIKGLNIILQVSDYVSVWKYLLYGVINFQDRAGVWCSYETEYRKFLDYALNLNQSGNLTHDIMFEINYHNSNSIIRRIIDLSSKKLFSMK